MSFYRVTSIFRIIFYLFRGDCKGKQNEKKANILDQTHKASLN